MADWTVEEQKAIRSLERLAKRWPDSLMLFSASGSLLVKRNDDRFIEDETEIIWGIPNDGGDPDWEHPEPDVEGSGLWLAERCLSRRSTSR